MSAPFYNVIKGTTGGTPGTGAFTPNAASSGFLAWSTVPTGWIGMVRYEDGSAWELQYSYWNGTTLSRSASAQFVASSTGSALTLTSAATAALVEDGGDVMPNLGSYPTRGWFGGNGSSASINVGLSAPTILGTGSSSGPASTNALTMQNRSIFTSATTANAQCGWVAATMAAMVSTTAGLGGFDFIARFGCSTLPTGPRLFVGMTGTSFNGNTGEPSALVANVAIFGLDSTDTNIQLMTNNGSGGSTKIDTGIPLAVNGLYECSIFNDPGSTKIYALLIRVDTGAIWFGSTTTDVPPTGAGLIPHVCGGLNGTNTGTAMALNINAMTIRQGF